MAVEKIITIKTDTKQAETDIDKLDNSLKNLDSNAEKGEQGVNGITKSFRGLAIAMKAAGIGLVIAAFAKLSEIFMKNQKVADAFNTTFEVISIAFNDFINFIINNGSVIVNFFESIFKTPQQSIKDFGDAIRTSIIERLMSLLKTLGFLSSAVQKVFSRDFKGALEDVTKAQKESIDVITGVNNSVDKAGQIAGRTAAAIKNYATETFNAAKANVELNREAEKGAALNRLLLEQFDRQAELQRQIRDDESRTIEDRIAANERLGELLAEQEKLMLANAQAQVDAAQAQFDKLANDENEIALLEAKAEKEGVLAQITGLRSEQLVNTNSLERERLDLLAESAEKELEIQETLEKAKQEMFDKTQNNIMSALGQNSKAGKAFAAAQALINTYQGITAELATKTATPFEFGIKLANIAATAAIGFKSVKDILKTTPSSASGVGGGQETTQAPSFNIVGATPTNQLAEAIGGQEQQPVQAYVVSNDVTTAQSLENNIIEGATLGG
jgi:hypothetical protein